MRGGLFHSINLSSIQMRSGWWQTEHLRLWAADGLVAVIGKFGTSAREGKIWASISPSIWSFICSFIGGSSVWCCAKIRTVGERRGKGSGCVNRREKYGDWLGFLAEKGAVWATVRLG